MKPAFDLYQSLNIDRRSGKNNSNNDNVLVHIFSNGGVNGLRTFVSLFPSSMTTAMHGSFTPRLLIVDSAPGIQTLKSAIAAFTADISNPFYWWLFSVFLSLMYFYMALVNAIFRREARMIQLRRWLADERGIGKKTKRLYIYSDIDPMSQKESVEGHIREIEEKGFSVASKNFGQSRHVGHMRANPSVYWGEVVRIWEESGAQRS